MSAMHAKVFMGRYEVQRVLGEGGMGKVYLAKQLDLRRQVVIKVMHEEVAADPKFQERFQREMNLMAQFQHPYAVTLYDASLDTPEGPCIIMEYVKGETLGDILEKEKRLSPARTGRFLGQLCEVLQAAHNQGIIHRDLKPTNLMVIEANTPYEKIKVMDFGLAKLVDSPSLKQMASSSVEMVIGTPAYISPEQVRGEEMDHRGDLYSVGVMLYELLTGQLPFKNLSTMDMLLAHATDAPAAMKESDVWVPPAIEAVVMRCLAKNPADRPSSAWELAQQYERALLDEVAEAEEPPPPVEEPSAPPPLPDPGDPTQVAYQLQAWMPEAVATYKVRGFVQDAGGEVIESLPGKVRVRLGANGSGRYQAPRNRLSWFGLGLGRSAIEMELQLYQSTAARQNTIWVTVIFRQQGKSFDRAWRDRCDQIYRDLRGYLIGSSIEVRR